MENTQPGAGFSFTCTFNKLQPGTLCVTGAALWGRAKPHRSSLRGAHSLEETRENKQVRTQTKMDADSAAQTRARGMFQSRGVP